MIEKKLAGPLEESMIQNLKDAGCSQELIDDFEGCWQKNQIPKALKLLAAHRAALLQEIHAGQKKIDSLDYLLYHIRKANTQA